MAPFHTFENFLVVFFNYIIQYHKNFCLIPHCLIHASHFSPQHYYSFNNLNQKFEIELCHALRYRCTATNTKHHQGNSIFFPPKTYFAVIARVPYNIHPTQKNSVAIYNIVLLSKKSIIAKTYLFLT